MFFRRDVGNEISAVEHALPGREEPIGQPGEHLVLGTAMAPPFPDDTETFYLAMGCFWGVERIFWQLDGVHTTAVGYQGGITPNPTYEEVCSGRTGHAEAVLICFKPAETSYQRLLKHFWENHDPSQGMRQGNDIGTQYRSAIYTTSDEQARIAVMLRDRYGAEWKRSGRSRPITTEIAPAEQFYYAEEYHQQYLAKNPNGYCNHGFNGVACQLPVG